MTPNQYTTFVAPIGPTATHPPPVSRTKRQLAEAVSADGGGRVTEKQIIDWETKHLIDLGNERMYAEGHVKFIRLLRGFIARSGPYQLPLDTARSMLNQHDYLSCGVDAERLDKLILPDFNEGFPDLFWSFHAGAWVTRRSVLYFYLSPQVPLFFTTKARVDMKEEDTDVASAGGTIEDSLIPYRETSLQTAEAMATLGVYRFLRQAYLAHRDDRLSFEQAVERIGTRVRQLAPLAIHEESRPTGESMVDSSGSMATNEAAVLHDVSITEVAASNGSGDHPGFDHPDLLQAVLDVADRDALVESARAVRRANEQMREWAQKAPGTELPDAAHAELANYPYVGPKALEKLLAALPSGDDVENAADSGPGEPSQPDSTAPPSGTPQGEASR